MRRTSLYSTSAYPPNSRVDTSHLCWTRAFHIVKAFIELGTQNSIESLQALCA